MANSTAMCTSFKQQLFQCDHNFINTNRAVTVNTADTFKGALYVTTGSLGSATTAYSATNEITGTNYTAGGNTLSAWIAPSTSGTTAFTTPSASIVYTNITQSTAFDSVLIYNSSNGNKAVSVHNFGAQTITSANLTLTMPSNAAGTALLNIA